MEYIYFKDMNTKQSATVLAQMSRIPSADWLNWQKFAVNEGGDVIVPLRHLGSR